MTGLRGLEGDFGGFSVPNFPDHDDIGVLPQNRAEGLGEGESGFRIHLNLVNALQHVLHRVLNRNDVDAGRAELVERRIKGCGFPRAGRSSDQEHPLRLVQYLIESSTTLWGHPQILELKPGSARIEQSDDNFFTTTGRQSGYSQIDFL